LDGLRCEPQNRTSDKPKLLYSRGQRGRAIFMSYYVISESVTS